MSAETFSVEDIVNDATFQRFIDKKAGLAKKTKEDYVSGLKHFCNYTGKSPTEIYDLHKSDLDNRAPEYDMWLSDAFDNYVSYLINSNYAATTIGFRITKISSFLSAFRLKPIPTVEITKRKVSEDAKYALTVEDIRKVVKNCTPTYQTIFITQAQTGLSISDVLLLDVGDFINAVSKKGENLTIEQAIYRVKSEINIIGCFDLRRKKTNIEFYTFVGPESLHNIALLLESRDDHLDLDDPIFIKNTDRLPKNNREQYLEDLRLTTGNVHHYVDRLNREKNLFSRIEVDGKERNYFRTHKLRKWYMNQLKNKAGFAIEDVKYLAGQKTGDVSERYFDYNSYSALKGNYRKALPHLAITAEIVMEENTERLSKLEQENKELKKDMGKIQSLIADIMRLNIEISSYKDNLTDMILKKADESELKAMSNELEELIKERATKMKLLSMKKTY